MFFLRALTYQRIFCHWVAWHEPRWLPMNAS